MKVVFRVDAGPKVGSGHLKRCLVLADAFFKSGAEIHFICSEGIGHFSDEIKSRNYLLTLISNVPDNKENKNTEISVFEHDINETIRAISNWSYQVDWLIVDSYSLSYAWENSLNIWVNNICVIDDFVNRNHHCDILINQSRLGSTTDLYKGLVPNSCTTLVGEKYVLLDENYSIKSKVPKKRSGSVKRVLVFFGGADSVNLTKKIMLLIIQIVKSGFLENKVVFDVVTTSINRNHDSIRGLCREYQFFNFYIDLPNLISLMWNADLAIGGVGTTSWERLCLSLPSFVITLSDNQVEFAKMLANKNLITLFGHYDNFDEGHFKKSVVKVVNQGVNSLISENYNKFVDGLGAFRCVEAIRRKTKKLIVRYAIASDENKILMLANDKVTRENSFNTEIITSKVHKRVFHNWLSTPGMVKQLIFEDLNGQLVGQVRFEYENGYWRLDYSVSAHFRGVGYGQLILKLAIRRLTSELGLLKLIAEVKNSNKPSKKIFVNLGFDVHTAHKDFLVYRFETCY